jgi:hypothetical protein
MFGYLLQTFDVVASAYVIVLKLDSVCINALVLLQKARYS